uniref:hypothetical protein n=1 Tax=Marinobacterium profundum TaxID=1714300 RepID=UPI000B17A156|nr:hypothetical protein [Marinobacterium profundum]
MKIVGDALTQLANENNGNDAELFCRSAFNRYYYSVYWKAREMLSEVGIDEKGHANIPSLLSGKIKRRIHAEIRKQELNGLLKSSEAYKLKNTVTSSIGSLATILTTARNIREIADYEPNYKINIKSYSFIIDECSLSTAEKWPAKASAYCKTIRRVWSELGL